MLYAATDPLNGAKREDVLIDRSDAAAIGVVEGDRIVLRSSVGSMEGTVKLAVLPQRSVQVHWPEGNVLIGGDAESREPRSQVPDYNAVVTIERIGVRA